MKSGLLISILIVIGIVFFAGCSPSVNEDDGGEGSVNCQQFCERAKECSTGCVADDCVSYCENDLPEEKRTCAEVTVCEDFNTCVCGEGDDDSADDDDSSADDDDDDDNDSGDDDDDSTCEGCLIETICYEDGDTKPGNVCLVCDVSESSNEWSNNDDTACNDEVNCTENDTCHGGECSGTPNDGKCDDSVDCTDDSCDATNDCQYTPNNSNCNDSIDCTDDTCDAVNDCQYTPNDDKCDDSVDCTDDTCDAVNDCQYTPNDSKCDDSVDCTDDTCDATNDCQFTPNNGNCDDSVDCTDDTCDAVNDCQFTPNDGNCDDSVDCTDDTCDAVSDCQYTPNDGNCDDSVDCTDDTCDAVNDCQYTPNNSNCDDSVDCTDDTCDIVNGCQFTPNDGNCVDNGLFCDGDEVCDSINDCVSEGNPCPNDNIYCNGKEICIEGTTSCGQTGTPCFYNETCIEEGSFCSPAGGNLDVAYICGSAPEHLYMNWGNGNGSFQSATDFELLTSHRGLVAGFFDGDGNIDVATMDIGSKLLEIYLGNGDGTFDTPAITESIPETPHLMTILYLDDDAILDIIVTPSGNPNPSDCIYSYIGNENGTFSGPTSIDVGFEPCSISSADLDGDGNFDLVLGDLTTQGIYVFYGNGDGTLQTGVGYATGTNPHSIEFGYFNQDMTLDIAVANRFDATVSVLLSDDVDSYADAENYVIGEGTETDFGRLVAGNFNEDDYVDLILATRTSISILLANSDGTFQDEVTHSVGGGTFLAIEKADFDGDNHLDIVVASDSGDGVFVVFGNGDGTFDGTSTSLVDPGNISSLSVADFN